LKYYGKVVIVLQAKKVPIPSETSQYPTQMPKPFALSPPRRPATKSRPQRVNGHDIVGAPLSTEIVRFPYNKKIHDYS